MDKYALIVAGGKGVRMKSDVPKQFLEINKRPLLMYTIDAFSNNHQIKQIILVIPNGYIEFLERTLCKTQF